MKDKFVFFYKHFIYRALIKFQNIKGAATDMR